MGQDRLQLRKTVLGLGGSGVLLVCALAALGCAASGTGGGGDDDSSSSNGEDLSGRKRVFITSAKYDGDLMAAGNGSSGVDGADKLCGISAAAAGLDGAWKAWLSDGTGDAIDRIADVGGPWYSVNRTTKVFNNHANLATKPIVAITLDENGQDVAQTDFINVWTGTKNGGRKDDDVTFGNCSDWKNASSTASYFGRVGDGGPDNWTDYTISECYQSNRLYCFEQ